MSTKEHLWLKADKKHDFLTHEVIQWAKQSSYSLFTFPQVRIPWERALGIQNLFYARNIE